MNSRIASGERHPLRFTFYDGDEKADVSDVPSVSVSRSSGAYVVEDGVTVQSTDTPPDTAEADREYVLTPAVTTPLDVLDAVWKGTFDGALQSFITEHHVVGSHYHSLGSMRAEEPLDDETRYPNWKLRAARDAAAFSLEHACGVAFVPSFGQETKIGSGNDHLVLSNPRPLAVTQILVDGVALDDDDLDQVILEPSGDLVRLRSRWPAKARIDVLYSHGWSSPPPRIVEAAKKLARHVLFDRYDSIPDRATALDTETGSYRLVTAGLGDLLYDVPEVNAAIAEYSVK